MNRDQSMSLQAKGFFGSLFDFSFKSLIAAKVIRVLYVLWMLVLALSTIGFVIAAFEINAGFGAVALLFLGPLYFFFWLIVGRVLLELIMAIFAIQQNTDRISPVAWPPSVQAHSEIPAPAQNGGAESVNAVRQDASPAN
jgi:Domain of unknown function (DUF4282)